ncbi:hypothetical protein AB0D67_10810 [Streptosporangium sp. NPDC048047]|uniref:hypothetical protein n=1 Tax=Streptosporangium sp. NPDC048047 TaxID=3155748 RepID=UPI00343CACF5
MARPRRHRILLHFDGPSWMYEKAPWENNDPEVIDMARVPGSGRLTAVGGNSSFDEDSAGWIWMRH